MGAGSVDVIGAARAVPVNPRRRRSAVVSRGRNLHLEKRLEIPGNSRASGAGASDSNGSGMGIGRKILLWASTNPTLSRRLPRYGFVKRAVRRFMPGEELDDALREASRLADEGFTAVVTHLGENVPETGEAEEVRDHYLDALDTVAERGLPCQVSVKLTQLGLDVSDDLCGHNLRALVERAATRNNFVWIDMEASPYVDRTLEQFRAVRGDHDNVGVCLQAYLRRTGEDLESLLEIDGAIRLVKGAYDEPPEIAFADKSEVDMNFYQLALRLLRHSGAGGATPGIATHDDVLVDRILMARKEGSVPTDAPFEIQMLYGIQTRNQKRWKDTGHHVRILISYGEHWYPWYVRRLAERPANVWFVLRNLFSR